MDSSHRHRPGAVVGVPTWARNVPKPPPVGGRHQQAQRHRTHAGPPATGRQRIRRHEVVRSSSRRTATFAAATTWSSACRPVGTDSGGDGMTTDETSRYWVTSHLGIQMFDPNGRMGGIVSRPQEKGHVSCVFAGAGRESGLRH